MFVYKARVLDFFKQMDTDNDGKLTKQQFIDGFLKSKFTTSRMELEYVTPIFDRNHDGIIGQKEYLDTLRPDRDLPRTDNGNFYLNYILFLLSSFLVFFIF